MTEEEAMLLKIKEVKDYLVSKHLYEGANYMKLAERYFSKWIINQTIDKTLKKLEL